VTQSVLIVAVLLVLLSAPALAAEGPKVGIDVFLGNSWHTRQAINVGGNVIYDPQWETRPFDDAWYYVARVRWGSIEVEWIHDKVFMGYDTPNVKGFNMSDGYNFVLMNAVQKWGHWEARLGAGRSSSTPKARSTAITSAASAARRGGSAASASRRPSRIVTSCGVPSRTSLRARLPVASFI